MRARCWTGKNEVRVQTVPDPQVSDGLANEGYTMFRYKEDNCERVVLKPT